MIEMPGAPIVLLFLDQLRADAIGAAGNAYVRTPHIDALAAESVRFETCITNAPLCRPARISLLSGQPVSVHRFDDNQRVPRPGSLPSHVAELAGAGYHTTVVGKTHLHAGIGHLDQHKASLEAWGYQRIVELPDAQMHQLRSAHSDWLTATTQPGDIDKHVRWTDFVGNHRPTSGPPDSSPWHLDTEDHLDSYCARRAAEAVRVDPGDRPLYLQVCFPGPHPPFDPTSEFLLEHPLPPPISGPRRGPVSPIELRYRRAQRRWTADDIARSRRAYFGKVALLDHAIGRVLAALEETDLDEQAWIILTADHGELLGDHGFHGKVLPFESSIRIPLLIRPPGGTTARVDRGVTELLDVVATIRGIAGLDVGGWGASLVDRVRAPSSPSPCSPGVVFGNLGYVGLRTPELTMTWDARTGDPLELFDRSVDPHQLENRVDDLGYKHSMRAGWQVVVDERARSSV